MKKHVIVCFLTGWFILLTNFSAISTPDPLLHPLRRIKCPYKTIAYRDWWYWKYTIDVEADNMESAISRLISFFEYYLWGWDERDQRFFGIPLIYEYAPFPADQLPFTAHIRSDSPKLSLEYLCKNTKGLFRSHLLQDRVLVIRKMTDSILLETKIKRIKRRQISIADAVSLVVQKANQQNQQTVIRFEHPDRIRIRGRKGFEQFAIFQTLPATILDYKIDLDTSGNNLMNALTDILIAQPIPFYLTLKPDYEQGRNTYRLSFDTLPDVPSDVFSDINKIKKGHISPEAYPYSPEFIVPRSPRDTLDMLKK